MPGHLQLETGQGEVNAGGGSEGLRPLHSLWDQTVQVPQVQHVQGCSPLLRPHIKNLGVCSGCMLDLFGGGIGQNPYKWVTLESHLGRGCARVFVVHSQYTPAMKFWPISTFCALSVC